MSNNGDADSNVKQLSSIGAAEKAAPATFNYSQRIKKGNQERGSPRSQDSSNNSPDNNNNQVGSQKEIKQG
jgi:hypothetical protein